MDGRRKPWQTLLINQLEVNNGCRGFRTSRPPIVYTTVGSPSAAKTVPYMF